MLIKTIKVRVDYLELDDNNDNDNNNNNKNEENIFINDI